MTDFEPVTLFVRGNENSSDEDAWDDTILVEQYDRSVNQLKQKLAKMGGSDSGGESASSKGKEKTDCKNRNKRYRRKPENQWQVGSFCRARYSEDHEFYEASILSVHENKGTCTVKYIGYENQEEVRLDSLLPTNGRSARKAQEGQAMTEQLQEIDVAGGIDQSDSCSGSEEWKKMKKKKAEIPFIARRHSRNMTHSPNVKPFSQNAHSQEHPFSGWPSHMPPPPPPPPPHIFEHFSSDDGEALSAMLMSWYMSGYHTGFYYGLKQAKSQQHLEDKSRHYDRNRKY